jgi:ubiquinol-cytochrome c reductase iron-sulfur subunit
MARAKDWLLATLVLLAGRRRGPRVEDVARPRLVARKQPNERAELVVLALLGLSSLAAAAFLVVYGVDRIPGDTQLLGLSLGLALLLLAAALLVIGKTLVPEEELEHEYPPDEHPEEQQEGAQMVDEATDGITRKRLLRLGLLGAGGTIALAAIAPALSFGPLLTIKRFLETPWRRGRRLVDEGGKPYRAADIVEGTFYSAFPEGADPEQFGAPLVVVRVPPGQLDLGDLAGYDAGGVVAYSAICTHAGCAISMYRVPTFAPAEPKPALVCPCHYSTFDPARGGAVIFGPAGRRLPMLPLHVDARGHLRAAGTFDEVVGPSWWGARSEEPKS